jgi:hypothetical protein
MSFGSTIQYKQGICVDCTPGTGVRPLVKDRCQYHYNQHLRLKSAKKAQARTKDNAKRYFENKAANAVISDSLSKWFDARRREMTGVCAECGNGTHRHSDVYFRFSIAHILPKKKSFGFPSVATHRDNWIELCINCHTKYDRNWLTASKMKVFAEARGKFTLFANDIALEERRRIPKELLE